MDSSPTMSDVVCSLCHASMARSDLEGHICSEHLDYYPYGCSYCGHWLATEDLAHFHAQKRQHLPMKIKENPNMTKERRLREALQQSLAASGHAGIQSPPLGLWQLNESSPSSTMNQDCGLDSIMVSETPSRSPNATPMSQASTKDLDSDAPTRSTLSIRKKNRSLERRPLSPPSPVHNDKRPRMEPATEDPAPIPIGDHPNEVHCRLCQMWLRGLNKMEHIRNHIKCRPRAACMYCQFKGATQNSVRVHITWKHAGRSTKVGFGVKDLSDIGSSEEEMIEMCFGSAPMTNTMEELMTIAGCKARTSKAQPTPRSVAGGGKSVGSVFARSTEHGVSALIRQDPLPPVKADRSSHISSASDAHKRVSTSASGRQYKHLVCQQCGQECLDALASAHIYQNHINERDAVKCPYCSYGVPYAIAEVKRHITAKHPGQPVDVIDRRGDLQNLYLHWRSLCFPEIGTGVRKQATSPLATMISAPPVSMVMASPGPLTIDLADEEEDEDIEDDAQPAATGGQRAKQINQNSRNKQKCIECGTEVTELWLPRHVWKHLSEEQNINCFKCRVPGCNYETYLKRSLDSHCSYHEKGKTTDHFGFIDKRNDFNDDYNRCLTRCFGDIASLLKLGLGGPDLQGESPPGEDSGSQQVFDDFPEITADDIDSVSAAISDLNVWCNLCEQPVLRDTVEDHVWQKHLGGQMPFTCNRCPEKFIHQIDIEMHWKEQHSDTEGEMDFDQDTEAVDRFDATMIECFPGFPDMSDPGFIKIEPEGPDAEYERSSFD